MSEYLNCDKMVFPGAGAYNIPQMAPAGMTLDDIRGAELVGFNYAMTEPQPYRKICHFYLADHQQNRVWNYPDRYKKVLRRFKAVLAPDFSMYTDFPKAIQIYNRYRSMWCAAYWQHDGITVIPTISWSDEKSL